MIRFVTYRNFPILDLQIEEAYRRRYGAREVVFLEDVDDIAVLKSLREARRRSNRSRDWLRRLAREVDALAQTPDPTARRRPSSRLVAANAPPRTAAGRKRQSRARG